jgi:flagellar motility protein MotE (MotC chaperone)
VLSALLLAAGLAATAPPGPPPAPQLGPPPIPAVAPIAVAPVPPAAKKVETPRAAPPALGAVALATELREGARRRSEDLAALQRERADLEKLAAEVAAARAALRDETQRLEARLEVLRKEAASHDERTARARADGRDAGSSKGAPADEQPDPARAEALAKTLKGMKADQAAALIGQLQRPLATAVLRRLKPGDAAAVLGRMKTAEAAELFTMLSHAESGGTR